MDKILKILLAASMITVAASCQWRPLVDPDNSIYLKVITDISDLDNINTNIYNDQLEIPEIGSEMFRAMFYDPETGKLLSQAFISEKTTASDGSDAIGGEIKITPGTYDLVCYSFDVPDTYIKDENEISTIYAYTNAVPESISGKFSIKADSGLDDVRYEPDHLLVAHEDALNIPQHTGALVIETTANTIAETYYLQVRVEGAQYVSLASAEISGMAPTNHFGIRQLDVDDPSSIYLNLQSSTDERISGDNKAVICCLFNTFGKIYESNFATDSELLICVTRTDGEVFNFTFDMKDIFNSENALQRHWLLLNDAITIPTPDPTPSTGGGFQPQVGEWENQYSDITL